jgi:hypothetical protein
MGFLFFQALWSIPDTILLISGSLEKALKLLCIFAGLRILHHVCHH